MRLGYCTRVQADYTYTSFLCLLLQYGEQGGKTCPDTAGCVWDVYSDSCGPFQIKKEYWLDCGKPGTGQILKPYIKHIGTLLSNASVL